MPIYSEDVKQKIFKRSLEELKVIGAWLQEFEGSGKIKPVTVLRGGWAVYSYNRWYQSIDIDLVTNKDTKESLMWYFKQNREFRTHREGRPTTVIKPLNIGGVRAGIIIDFISRSEHDTFEGIDEKPLGFEALDAHTTVRTIDGGVSFRVPDRSLLLLYKLKAAYDRGYRLRTGSSRDEEYEISKLEKDHCDILALLDRSVYDDELDYALLAEEFDGRDFLRDEIRRLPSLAAPINRYERMKHPDVEEVCENLLLLTKK
jgi:hypothetical protein